MSNTVAFPTGDPSKVSVDTISLAHRTTALDICDLVYGPTIPSWSEVERFYEPNASYENPLITASSRAVIADIHSLAGRLSHLDMPKPAALLYGLFGVSRDTNDRNSWFKMVSMWNEVLDVSENESFDGHQKIIVEHTLHIDILPGLLSTRRASKIDPSTPSTSELPLSLPHHAVPRPSTTHSRGNRDPAASPSILHLSLPIITRLSFNDAGKITHHRDFWDVKDLLNLLPGMSFAQYVTTRLIAQSIRGIVSAGRVFSRPRRSRGAGTDEMRDEEEGLSPAALYAREVKDETSDPAE